MKKIYFTMAPMDNNFKVSPKQINPVECDITPDDKEYYYGITPVIKSTIDNDQAKLVIIQQSRNEKSENRQLLLQELNDLHLGDQLEVKTILVEENQKNNTLLNLFEAIINETEENAEYYADVTFGPKSFPIILLVAMNYVTKVYNNVEIMGLYYLEVLRNENEEHDETKVNPIVKSNLYEMSVFVSLNSIIEILTSTGTSQKKENLIHHILHPEEGIQK